MAKSPGERTYRTSPEPVFLKNSGHGAEHPFPGVRADDRRLPGGWIASSTWHMKNALLVFLGGGLGSVLRYGTVLALARLGLRGSFPWSILVANLLGSFVLGLLFALPAMRSRDSATWAFAATGVLGGYTTFSTLSNDSLILWQNGHGGLALLNSAGSAFAGILCAAAGWHLGKALS